jgi:hypothetical protein
MSQPDSHLPELLIGLLQAECIHGIRETPSKVLRMSSAFLDLVPSTSQCLANGTPESLVFFTSRAPERTVLQNWMGVLASFVRRPTPRFVQISQTA